MRKASHVCKALTRTWAILADDAVLIDVEACREIHFGFSGEGEGLSHFDEGLSARDGDDEGRFEKAMVGDQTIENLDYEVKWVASVRENMSEGRDN